MRKAATVVKSPQPKNIFEVENKSIGHSREKSRHEKHFEEEENIFHPSHYTHFGCPTLPIAFAGMTGRLGNIISNYANFIALQWTKGYKYFLPRHLYGHPGCPSGVKTKPYISSIFRNVSFPTASWTWGGNRMVFNPKPDDVLLFHNDRTNGIEVACPSVLARRVEDVAEAFDKPSCSAFGKVVCGDLLRKMTLIKGKVDLRS